MDTSKVTPASVDSASNARFELRAGTARVLVFDSVDALATAAAKRASEIITAAIESKGTARVVVATGNSQLAFIEKLVRQPGIDWPRVTLFHMDEYVGLSDTHPASFRLWIRTRVAEQVPAKETHYIHGDAADLDAEIKRYSDLLNAAPLDLAFVGIGENGHIAFNDPHLADFHDPATVKCVQLDEACKRQQTGEGHFSGIDAVPDEAVSVTCPGLFRAEAWITVVPDRRKAVAVRNAIEGPITTECPASIIQTHPNATIFLDLESASLLNELSIHAAEKR
jgi:glucosamine-6-phosphate deaminase